MWGKLGTLELALKFKTKKEILRFHVQELMARLTLSRKKDKEVFLTL